MNKIKKVLISLMLCLTTVKAQNYCWENENIRGVVRISLGGEVELIIENMTEIDLYILSPEYWSIISERTQNMDTSQLSLGIFPDTERLSHYSFDSFPLVKLPSKRVLELNLDTPLLDRKTKYEVQLWSVRLSVYYDLINDDSCVTKLDYSEFRRTFKRDFFSFSSLKWDELHTELKSSIDIPNYNMSFGRGAKFEIR